MDSFLNSLQPGKFPLAGGCGYEVFIKPAAAGSQSFLFLLKITFR